MVAGLAVLHLILVGLSFVPSPHPGGDNGVYLALARSLLEGDYRDIFDPAAPVHRQWPPLWPMLIAALLAVGLEGWIPIKVMVALFSAVGVVATYAWIRARGRPRLALGVGFLAAVSPGVLVLSRWELSDVPFWALTMAALVLWERAARSGTPGSAASAGAMTVAAYLTRAAGLPLMVAGAGWLLLARRWRQLAAFAAVAVPAFAGWTLWTRASGGYASYLLYRDAYDPSAGTIGAGELIARIGESLPLYTSRFLPVMLAGGYGFTALTVLAAIVLLWGVWGWLRHLRRAGVAEVWTPMYLGMILVWNPEWAGERLLLPVYAVILFYAAEGLVGIREQVHAFGRVPIAAIGLALLFLVGAPGSLRMVQYGTHCSSLYRAGDAWACLDVRWRDYMRMAEYAGENLPEGSVVLSRKPALFWTASGLPGIVYPFSREPADLLRAAEETGARYLVMDQLDGLAQRYLTPILMRRPQAFCVIHSDPTGATALLGIVPGAKDVPDVMGDPGEAQMQVAFQLCGPQFLRPGAGAGG